MLTVYTQYTDMYSSFVISQSDRRPMYLQIMEQIKQKIAVGDLKVSVITVKRAYLELEHEGVIVTQQGRGSRVAVGAEIGTRLHEEELKSLLDRAARLGALMGIEPSELAKRLGDAAGQPDASEERPKRKKSL